MEYWNVDLKEEPLTTNMPAPMSRVIFPMSYLPKAHYSIIPVFQHSNWGKAPKFIITLSDFGGYGQISIDPRK